MRLKNYLNKEIGLTSAGIFFILLLIFTSQQFVRFLGDVVDGKIAPGLLMTMVGLQLPPLFGFLLPLALFLGVLTAYGQLYVENELTVARSIGIGNEALAKMAAPFALYLAGIAAVFSLWVAPWSANQQLELLKQQDSQSELALLTPGRFQTTGGGESVLYTASQKESGQFGQVFIATMPNEKLDAWQVVSASSGHYRTDEYGRQLLTLNNGQVHLLPQTDQSWMLSRFAQYDMVIPEEVTSLRKQKVKTVGSIDLFKGLSQDDLAAEYWAEIHWRLSVPISIPLLLLLAIPLSRVEPRQGKFARMLPAIAVYLTYMIAMLLTKGLIEDKKLPGILGFWWIHLLFAIFVYWQYQAPKWALLKAQRKSQ